MTPEAPEVLLLAQIRDFFDFFLRELELLHLQILLQPLFTATGRHGYNALINHPSQSDLSWSNTVLLGQALVCGIHGSRLSFDHRRQWPKGRSGDIVLSVKVDEIAMLEVGVVLNLINSWGNFRRLENDLQFLLGHVRNANRFGFPCGMDFF